MKIDTEIRHVTKPGANLFLELGFAPAEAKRLQAACRKQINATQLLKQQLMEELSSWITEHHLKQAGQAGDRSTKLCAPQSRGKSPAQHAKAPEKLSRKRCLNLPGDRNGPITFMGDQ